MSKNYINREELDKLLTYHSEHYQDEHYKMDDELATAFMLIAKNILRRPNFSGYSFKHDMFSDAVYDCIRYSKNYRYPGNSFAYISQIQYQSIVRRITKEKKAYQGKIKYIQSLTTSEIYDSMQTDENMDMESFETFKELYEKNLEELPLTIKEKAEIETSLTKMFED